MTRHVSVIVLGYGAEEHLEECLASIVTQLPANGELILVDNGIADGTRRRSSWDPRVRVLGDGTSNTGFAGGARSASPRRAATCWSS